MTGSSLPARTALTMLLLLAGAAHAIHLVDPNRTPFRVLDGCLVVGTVAVGGWVMSNRGDRRRAADAGFVMLLVLVAVAIFGF